MKKFVLSDFIRKLLESRYKVTDKFREINIEIETCKFIGKRSLILPIGNYNEYDFENTINEIINIKDLTHQFVHSQIFFGEKVGKGLSYIYVSSDHKLYTKLYKVNINDIIEIFNIASEDFVSSIRTNRDIENGKINIQCN